MTDREDGWYRVTGHDWERVADEVAEAEVAEGGGWDLVRVKSQPAGIEIPLF